MTDFDEDTGRVTAEAMQRVNTRVCNYKCGECPYDERAEWSVHEAHHRQHLAERKAA